MAQLKDLLVNGSSRFIGDIYGNLRGNADTATKANTATTATTADKVKGTLTIKIGSTTVTYNGSSEQTVTITPSTIGAAASSHTHTKSQITDFAHNHDDRYYTETEIDTKLSTLLGTNNAMVFKGAVNKDTDLPAKHSVGWTYWVNTAGMYASKTCEVGDLIICTTAGTAANNDHWIVAQTNIDGAVTGPTSSTTNAIPTFADTAGKAIKNNPTVTIKDGLFTAPYIATGDDATHYFQSRKFRGEGNANSYYHAIDFGYTGHNQVDFHEYGGVWNFYKNTAGTATGNNVVKVASIESDGFHGNLRGNVAGNITYTTARNFDGINYSGDGDVIHYGTCSTAAATAAKTVNCTNFKLVTGSRITVKFTVTNTANNPTLNVNSTGAKAIYYRGSAIGAGYLAANRTYTFIYNGTQYDLVGDLDTNSNTWKANTSTQEGYVAKPQDSSGNSLKNKVWKTDANGVPAWRDDNNTDTKVTQTLTSDNKTYPLLLAPTGQTKTTTTQAYFDSGVTLNPSSNTIAANITGNAGSADKVNNNLVIQLNSGTTEGTNQFTYNGSATKNINITPANIGAASSSHNHNDVYVKKSGDTMTGLLKTNGSIENQGEAKFTHPTYCPDVEDTAENIGCAFKASRGHFNQMNVNEIYLPATTTTNYEGNKISFKTYSGGNNGAYANVSEVVQINTAGLKVNGYIQTTAENKTGDFATIGDNGQIYKRTPGQARQDMGLSTAMHFIGKATVDITDGSTVDPKITNYTTKTAGDVIIDKNNSYEYVWTLEGKWERLGPDGSYSVIGHNHDSDYVKKTGDTMTGNLVIGSSSIGTNGYITGTWLQTTSAGYKAGDFATIDNSGWIYKMKPTDVLENIGGQAKITATGMLKGDGNGGVTAAIKGTDYNTEIGIVHYEDKFDDVEAAYNKCKILRCIESKAGIVTSSGYVYYTLRDRVKTSGSNSIDGTITTTTYLFTLVKNYSLEYIKLVRKVGSKTGTTDTWSKGSSTYTPSKHASTHGTSGTDPITPSDIGAAPSSHSHNYLPLSGGTLTGELAFTNANAIRFVQGTGTTKSVLMRNDGNNFYIVPCNDTTGNSWYIPDGGSEHSFRINLTNGFTYVSKLYGAVWNDYAEFRQGDTIEAGHCVIEVGDDTLITSTKRLMPGANITSDTFGFSIGETEQAKTPIAVSGRVLAYPYESREEFKKNIGRPVCSGPNGTVSIMTDEEYRDKGYCAIGTISAVPDYEEWGTGKVKVNGRVWIKVF